MDHKKTTREALERYFQKQLEVSSPKRKNEKPEEELRQAIIKYLREKGFLAYRMESKGTWSPGAGRFLSGPIESGSPDVWGSLPQSAISLYLELKAPGRRATLQPHQREFLIQAINHGAFACCSDSIVHFDNLYSLWLLSGNDKNILLNDLPKQPKKDDRELFEDV